MSYIFEYEGLVDGAYVRPKWLKIITEADGVEHRIILNFSNEAERETLTIEQVYSHLDNLVQYMKDVSQGIFPLGLEESPADGWHFKGGWGEVEWAKEESLKWWESVYFKDEPEIEEEPA
jgi:hypothetical protein